MLKCTIPKDWHIGIITPTEENKNMKLYIKIEYIERDKGTRDIVISELKIEELKWKD